MSQKIEKVNPRLIKSNIDLWSKIVKRPAITEKILSRPPFRFLFDLTTMTIKTTGYLRGLYTEDEFNFENVNSNKETKMAFLDKLIEVIGLINPKFSLDIKSSKIVSGVECEKTNKFLNEFAKCVLDKRPFVESVERLRKDHHQQQTTNPSRKESSASSMGINRKSSIQQSSSNQKSQNRNHSLVSSDHNQPSLSSLSKTDESSMKNKNRKQSIQSSSLSSSVTKRSNQSKLNDRSQMKNSNFNSDQIKIDVDNNNDNDNNLKRNDIEDADDVDGDEEDHNNLDSEKSFNRNHLNDQENEIESIYRSEERKEIETSAEHNNEPNKIIDSISNIDQNDILSEEKAPKFLSENVLNIELNTKFPYEKNAQEKFTDRIINDVSSDHQTDSEQKNRKNFDDNSNTIVVPIDYDEGADDEIVQADKNSMNNKHDDDVLDSRREDQQKNSLKKNFLSESQDLMQRSIKEKIRQSTEINSEMISESSNDVPMRQSARPKSSRPAPPRVMTASRSRLNALNENRVERLSGETTAQSSANIWTPTTIDDKNDEFLISSQKLQESFLTDAIEDPMDIDDSNHNDFYDSGGGDGNKGHLVKQIMKTKQELEGQIKTNQSVMNESMLSSSSPIASVNDTDRLKSDVQSLCQMIGTLSKTMAYLHEDVGPMFDELKKWQNEYQNNCREIKKLRIAIDSDAEPLIKELDSIEKQVEDLNNEIRLTKSNIFRNTENLFKLIETL
ncbi:TRAF3-interacting protein 1 [Sarcoptes scabiei]|uniref:TRAF3-interacting protein 1 n=1 Tax=Sarcoptes scabiei TaxID=52283 RepID=A0A834VIB1_SARSC|nr:TRAF3-interacting protein 1 [Sarcoptes scabiei]